MGPTLSASKPAHRVGIICGDLVLLLMLALAGMKTIKEFTAKKSGPTDYDGRRKLTLEMVQKAQAEQLYQ